jgi:hypothetical protein
VGVLMFDFLKPGRFFTYRQALTQQKFNVLLAWLLSVVCELLRYETLKDSFRITDVESVYCEVHTESLYRAFHSILRDYKHL